ncbi:glycoside hydrolase family 26 protein [Actinomadura madurae]|uniref:glycoside hydrolase family 26 protein n=1 Tax=Actinomadura madurae TaxID=1993 RepID=UPI000DD0DBF9|nr:glycosyl hydrolase [Actinomadura madurae]
MLVALIAPVFATWPQLRSAQRTAPYVPLGAFLGSGGEGVARLGPFERWLGSTVTVGRTYLPGDDWDDIEGPRELLAAWARWKEADPRRMLVVNVPMMAPNETWLPRPVLASLLRAGARGVFDGHYRALARRLVSAGAGDAVLVPGWEMNGEAYAGRCAPDPEAWKTYWRRIVAAMRGVPGTRLRFDFAPSRGRDAIPWTQCYPGDDVVDIIGSDSYDQPAGKSFQSFVDEPYGLRDHADFAAAHGKPISFPEWGLFRNSDNPEYVRGMHDWIMSHDVAYQSITDYCPHGVWSCGGNPRSAAAYRELFGGVTAPPPSPSGPFVPAPSPAWKAPAPAPTPARPGWPEPPATARVPAVGSSGAPPAPATSRVTAARSATVPETS